MKTTLTFILTIVMTSICYAQSGINYKAIIKDANGNVIKNELIQVQFSILEGISNVYQETHAPTTDANGLIVLHIGQGTTVDVFTDINWSNDDHFLNVQIDSGAGLVDLGTTQFMAVPYAVNAETANNVNGLETLDEGNGRGWRLKGKNPNFFGAIGLDAIDLSYSNVSSSTFGATGTRSYAIGYKATASGLYSTALGVYTIASGENALATGRYTEAVGTYSTTLGQNTQATRINSTAMGYLSVASGANATAMGEGTNSSTKNGLAIGRFNVGGGTGVYSWIENDPLFEVGIGTANASRKNAITVLKNGNIGIDTSTPNTKLQITGGNDASNSNATGYLVLGNEAGLNVVFDNNEIIARNNASESSLYVQQTGGSTSFGGNVSISGIASTPSVNNTLIDNASSKVLVTKEYTEAKYAKRTKEIVIPSAAFLPNSNLSPVPTPLAGGPDLPAGNRYWISTNGVFYGSSDYGNYMAPLTLPVGTIINEISAFIYDNSPTNIQFSLTALKLTNNIDTTIFTLSTDNSNTNQVLTNSGPITIQTDYMYFFKITTVSGTDWGAHALKALK